jgi:hypothetical protein
MKPEIKNSLADLLPEDNKEFTNKAIDFKAGKCNSCQGCGCSGPGCRGCTCSQCGLGQLKK